MMLTNVHARPTHYRARFIERRQPVSTAAVATCPPYYQDNVERNRAFSGSDVGTARFVRQRFRRFSATSVSRVLVESWRPNVHLLRSFAPTAKNSGSVGVIGRGSRLAPGVQQGIFGRFPGRDNPRAACDRHTHAQIERRNTHNCRAIGLYARTAERIRPVPRRQ